MSLTRHIVRGVAISAVLLAAACQAAVNRVFTPPVLTFKGVSVRGFGVTGSALDIYLGIQNPNRYALKATGASYRVFVRDSVEVGRGTTTDTVVISGYDSATVRLPLDVRWAGLGVAGLDALTGGGAQYHIVGDVIAATPFGSHTVPVNVRGRARAR